MRTSLAVMLAFLPLVQAQDPRLLKSVEPNYDRYNEDLTAGFDVANASVTLAIQADGKPFALSSSSIPLPMVAFEALITKQGDIKSLKISNGQFVLMEAVYDAVKQWQYRTYLIMGEPVEVLTEIGSSSP